MIGIKDAAVIRTDEKGKLHIKETGDMGGGKLAVGVIQAIKGAGWGAGILGVINILIGILLLANLWLFTFSLPWTIGILCIIGGILAIILAFRVK